MAILALSVIKTELWIIWITPLTLLCATIQNCRRKTNRWQKWGIPTSDFQLCLLWPKSTDRPFQTNLCSLRTLKAVRSADHLMCHRAHQIFFSDISKIISLKPRMWPHPISRQIKKWHKEPLLLKLEGSENIRSLGWDRKALQGSFRLQIRQIQRLRWLFKRVRVAKELVK